ncbi:MAG: hypothetical protein CL759_11430 [Chloroflexi bacterium]|nr:hypothetical protein [Chloroflexota bacterium]
MWVQTGRKISGISLASALVALAVAPVVFGVLGVLLGAAGVAKGDRIGGMAGVVASAVLAVTGYYLAGEMLT